VADGEDTAVVWSENVELARRLMAELPLDDLAGAVRDPERG
jgi:hypothetical protein